MLEAPVLCFTATSLNASEKVFYDQRLATINAVNLNTNISHSTVRNGFNGAFVFFNVSTKRIHVLLTDAVLLRHSALPRALLAL